MFRSQIDWNAWQTILNEDILFSVQQISLVNLVEYSCNRSNQCKRDLVRDNPREHQANDRQKDVCNRDTNTRHAVSMSSLDQNLSELQCRSSCDKSFSPRDVPVLTPVCTHVIDSYSLFSKNSSITVSQYSKWNDENSEILCYCLGVNYYFPSGKWDDFLSLHRQNISRLSLSTKGKLGKTKELSSYRSSRTTERLGREGCEFGRSIEYNHWLNNLRSWRWSVANHSSTSFLADQHGSQGAWILNDYSPTRVTPRKKALPTNATPISSRWANGVWTRTDTGFGFPTSENL